MSEKIAFVADSCADLPKEIREREGVFVLPVIVTVDGKDYRDAFDIEAEVVYEAQKRGENPGTSLPSGETIKTLFDEIAAQGYRKVVVINMSSAISGTWNVCRLFCSERSDLDCIVFDSKMASVAEGALLIELMDEVQAGKVTWEEIPQRFAYLQTHTFPYFGIDTLEFLQKNGRIGKATAIAGNLLNLMPILSFDENGVINPVEKVRGKKKRLEHLKNNAINHAGEQKNYRLYFADGGCPEMTEELKEMVCQSLGYTGEIITANLGCALAVHLGKNLVGVCVQVLGE